MKSYRVVEPPHVRFRRWISEEWSVMGVDGSTLRKLRGRPVLTVRFLKRLYKRLRVVTA